MLIKILVVDDSASDRLIIKNMLSEYNVLTACDGVEALRVLVEHDGINLLILDLNMPNMNGFQVLESLNQDERFRNLRTIILTNYDELDNEIKGLKLGAVDYIRKPIHMDSLKARIDVHAALLRARQALEQKIDEQALTFDMIFDQAPIGIAISHSRDPKCSDKDIIKINSAYEQITGRTKEELINSGWANITHPDDLDEDIDNFNKLQAGELKSYSMEKRYVKPDGSVVWVYMVVAALAPLAENKLNHMCLIQDITNQKAAMAALIESEKKYRSITENMSDVVWQMDLNLKTTYVSPSVEKLLGESIEEHMNRTMEEKFPAQTLHKIQSFFYEELEKEKDPQIDKNRSRTLELEHYRADMTTVWLAIHISMIRDENGNPVGFQGVSRDISEIKNAEKELRNSEEKHRRLFETMAQGVVYQASDGAVISANPAAERILGMTLDQMRGKTSMDSIWKAITEDGSEILGSDHPSMIALRTGKPFGPFIMGIFQPSNNNYVWLSVKAIPLFRSGVTKPFQVYTTFEDITAERKARQNYELLFREMLDAFAVHEIICDDQGTPIDYRFLAVNPAFERMTGLKSTDILGKTVLEILPDTEPYWIQIYGRVALTGDPITFTSYSMVMDRYYEVSSYQPVLNQFATTFSDVTDRIIAENALIESDRSKSVLLSNLPGMAYRCNFDRDWTMQYVSKGCYDLTGYKSESLVNNKDLSYNDLISPEYREALWNMGKQILSKRLPFKYEYEIITATGERKWVIEMGQGIYNDEGEVEALEGIILDISDRKEMENHLRYMNEHDNWTGLYNRDYLEALLNHDLKKKDGLNRAVISINLSTVQLLTANYGFHYTQNLIKVTAETLSQYCSDNRLLFQAYENRFVFYLIDYKDKNELVEFSDIIAEAVEALFVTERIGGGIGILEIEQDDDEIDVDLLLRKLLIASERAIAVSEKDFDACFYNEELEAEVNREGDIRKALGGIAVENTNDELFLHYQPILDLRTNGVCGFEALARLKTEKLGLVSPVEFIPIAEKTKMIIPIGEKVMINAFHFLNKLKASGYDEVGVAINVSAIQLFSPDFTSRFLELMSEMQVNSRNIGIEITESVFASDYERINNIIEKLREAGVHIAIDDFGTGYSSLAREKELSVDCLKIDKYFIDKLLETDLSKAITSDIISMSHKLGHCTIAEGVEYESQLQYLKEHSCDRIQGYLFSKPLNEEDALEFLKSKNKYDCHSNDSRD